MNRFPDPSKMSREELIIRYREAIGLIDGCYEVIEIWKAESPSQITWKTEWLMKAHRHGASGF